jgi:hypothetical protein
VDEGEFLPGTRWGVIELRTVQRQPNNLVLAYQGAPDYRREHRDRLRGGFVEVLVYSAVWGAFGALLVAAVGAVFLWGVLIANAAG